MRFWIIYVGMFAAAHFALWWAATFFPSASSAIFTIGTPIIAVGAGLGTQVMRKKNTSSSAARR